MVTDLLTTIVLKVIGDKTIVRINDVWVAVNEIQFGYNRAKVLEVLQALGFEKRHVMLYDRKGRSSTLTCYVRGEFNTEDKPLIGPIIKNNELNQRFAREFLKDLKDRFIKEQLPAALKIDPPFFDLNEVDGKLTFFFTREKLRKILSLTWYTEGKTTRNGILILARTIGQLSEDFYFRKNTYFKNAANEHRARIEDKLIYKYTFE